MGMAITRAKISPVDFCCIGCFKVASFPILPHKRWKFADEDMHEKEETCDLILHYFIPH